MLTFKTSDSALVGAVAFSILVCSAAVFLFGDSRRFVVDENYFDPHWLAPRIYFVLIIVTIHWVLAVLVVGLPGFLILRKGGIDSRASLVLLGAVTGLAATAYPSTAAWGSVVFVSMLCGAAGGALVAAKRLL